MTVGASGWDATLNVSVAESLTVPSETEKLQTDPAWKDNLLFSEYFHGDNGAGLGAAHQTGWTALVVDLILAPPSAGRDRERPGRRPSGP